MKHGEGKDENEEKLEKLNKGSRKVRNLMVN